MICTKDLLQNITNIAHIEALQKAGKDPTVGVYRGKLLMVVSHRPNSSLNKLYQHF